MLRLVPRLKFLEALNLRQYTSPNGRGVTFALVIEITSAFDCEICGAISE